MAGYTRIKVVSKPKTSEKAYYFSSRRAVQQEKMMAAHADGVALSAAQGVADARLAGSAQEADLATIYAWLGLSETQELRKEKRHHGKRHAMEQVCCERPSR